MFSISKIVKIILKAFKLKEYKPPHYKQRVVERKAPDYSVIYILGHIIIEYGYKETPNSEPRPLLKPNRRAFLVMGRGTQAIIYIIDASEDVAALVTVITIPHDEWGPLPERYRRYTSVTKKKKK